MEMEKKVRTTKLITEVPLCLPTDTADEVVNEIIDVLKATRFNKISVPLTTYRTMLEDGLAEDDTRITTIGYIKKFDSVSKTFNVVIFANSAKTIEDNYDKESLGITLFFTKRKDGLGSITNIALTTIK